MLTFLPQAGVFIARYFRPRDPWWFRMHRALQSVGLLFAVIGFAFGIASTLSRHFQFAHGAIGLVAMILAILQPLNAFFRPHKQKGQPLTRARIAWEYLHRWSGRISVLLGLINISLGMFFILAPRGVYITWFVLLALWVACNVIMEIRLRLAQRQQHQASSQIQTDVPLVSPASETGFSGPEGDGRRLSAVTV